MSEPVAVTLARIEERIIALHDKVDDHLQEDEKTHAQLEADVGSLKESRARARGVAAIGGLALGWLGFDRFF